jgi:hypothetical protein
LARDDQLSPGRRGVARQDAREFWRALRTELADLRAEVDRSARQREADLATLDRLQGLWRLTLEQAHRRRAPEPVFGRIEATLAAIDATRARVEVRQGRVLVLQDAVSRASQACDDALVRIAERSAGLRSSAGEPPLWPTARRIEAERPRAAPPSSPTRVWAEERTGPRRLQSLVSRSCGAPPREEAAREARRRVRRIRQPDRGRS